MTESHAMRQRNDRAHYGAVSIALHWLGALAVTAMLGSALAMYAYGADEARRLPYIYLHASTGVVLAALLLVRIVWHFVERQPDPLARSQAVRRLASGVHVALLVLIAAQLVTGPLDVWSSGFALRVFDWAVLPSPFGSTPLAWHDAIGDFHVWCGAAIALLVGLHLAGVAKHFLIDDDDTLARMLGLTEQRP